MPALLLVVIASCCFFSGCAKALVFDAPVCGKPAQGGVTLQVSGAPPATSVVRFAIGSHQIGIAQASPFRIPWNTAEAMDGVSAIQASALDNAGNVLGSAECLVQIANRGVTMDIAAPDVTKPLAGVVTIAVQGSDTAAYPAVWMLNVDGEEQATVWTDNAWKSAQQVSFTLDTTRFANGSHEIQISMNSRTGPQNPQWVNWRGMVNRVADFENGHAWMDVLPGFQSLYVRPGEKIALGCRRQFTDASAGACGAPVYASSDPTVAVVDATGQVTALRPGFAHVTLQDGDRTSSTRVWVQDSSQVPHFSGSGELLHSYVEGKSLFVIAPFFLDPGDLKTDDSLTASVRASGVNAVGFGVYNNPRNVSFPYSQWKANYDATIAPKMDWAKSQGFHLLLSGDDIFRNPKTDAYYTLNWPSAPEALQYAAQTMANTGVGIGIEGIDEASMMWGPQPSSSLRTMRGWLTASQPAMPVTFPSLAADKPQIDGNWMGPNGISDYASHYFTSLKTRTTYPWSEGIQEMVGSLDQEFTARQPYLMLDRPQLMLVSMAGPFYKKGAGSSPTYQAGIDDLDEPGNSPEHVSALMMTAASLGAAGIRLYYFEPPTALAKRAAATPGISLETGANPVNLQTGSWRAMSLAANLLTGALQPYLLGEALNAPALGRNIVATVRQGASGKLLLIVNGNDWPRSLSVDLTAYSQGAVTTRYLLSATALEETELPAGQMSDPVRLGAGESVAYLLPNAPGNAHLTDKRAFAWLDALPTVMTTGYWPGARSDGTCKLTCSTPAASPGAPPL